MKRQLATYLRSMRPLNGSMADLAAWCQALGQSGRGSKTELVERLHKTIWRREYD